MLRGTFETSAWVVETWERPREPGVASRDGLLVDPRPGALRLAVIDGVTPTDATPGHAGVDGGIWAAATVRSALLARVALETCALAANAALRATVPVPSPRDRPQASFAGADLADVRAEFVRGGDCEVWVQRHRDWERIFPREIDTPVERERMERWTQENPSRPYLDYDRARPESKGIWTSTALGRLPHPTLQAETVRSYSAVVLASDGARLHEEALAALPEWLESIDEHQRGRPVSAWEGGADDVAVIRARRRRDA
jgi:hypothetical protein